MIFQPFKTAIYGDNAGSTNNASGWSCNGSDFGGSYFPQGFVQDWPESVSAQHGGGPAFDEDTGLVWVYDNQARVLKTIDFSQATPTYTNRSSQGVNIGRVSSCVIDLNRRLFIYTVNRSGTIRLGVYDIDINGDIPGSTVGDFYECTNYSGWEWTSSYASLVYEPVGGKIIGYRQGATLRELNIPADYRVGGALNKSASYSWSTISNGPGGATPPNLTVEGDIQNRLQYIKSIKAFAVILNGRSSNDSAMYVYKIPAGGL
jgi:hypothetical protein